MAYNASLQCAAAALHASGYRTRGEGHHERVINSLKFTVKASEEMISQLHRIRIKRNRSSYDIAGTTSEQEVKEALEFALELKSMVKSWLRENHPELLG
jgi:hypothetical protein